MRLLQPNGPMNRYRMVDFRYQRVTRFLWYVDAISEGTINAQFKAKMLFEEELVSNGKNIP